MTIQFAHLELRKVKIHRDMSEETIAFSADLYVKGVKSGRVSNEGQGGPNRFTDWKVEQEIGPQADEWISLLVEQVDIKKTAARLAKRFLRGVHNPRRAGVIIGLRSKGEFSDEFLAMLDTDPELGKLKFKQVFTFDADGKPL